MRRSSSALTSSSFSSSSSLLLYTAAASAAATALGMVAGALWSRRKKTKNAAASSRHDDCIYLDYNATTPIDTDVLAAMLPYLTQHFGNPSSRHVYGRTPKHAIQTARAQILHELLDQPQEPDLLLSSIVFTGCGTEADNLAIHLALQVANARAQVPQVSQASQASPTQKSQPTQTMTTPRPLPHIVTLNIEHPAISACLEHYQAQKQCVVTFVPVQRDTGIVRVRDIADAMIPNQTVLVTVMTAHNEVGSLQPIAEIAQLCRQMHVLFHTDAAQAAGKIPLVASCRDADFVTLVGHKFGAPKGIACLYIRPGCLSLSSSSSSSPDIAVASNPITVTGMILGGGQEHGLRAGTENTPYIVGMGVAAAKAARNVQVNAAHMRSMRDLLYQCILQELFKVGNTEHKVVATETATTTTNDSNHNTNSSSCRNHRHNWVRVNGPTQASQRLPNTLSISFRNVDSAQLLHAIGDRVAASAGATCHNIQHCITNTSTTDADAVRVSSRSALLALGVPMEYARGTLRLSVGPTTTPHEVRMAARMIAGEVLAQWQNDTTT